MSDVLAKSNTGGNDIEHLSKYNKLKKFVAKHIKKAKRAFYESYFKKYCHDGRKQWQMVNQLLNRKTKSRISISKIKFDENLVTGPIEIAQSFNEYFCSIAQRLKDDTKPSPGDSGRPPELTINSTQRNHTNMEDTDCTVDEIEKCISSLKNKATFDLAMQPQKFVSKAIAPVLQHLISVSLLQGIFPTKLKCAKVIPIHKGGS